MFKDDAIREQESTLQYCKNKISYLKREVAVLEQRIKEITETLAYLRSVKAEKLEEGDPYFTGLYRTKRERGLK